MHVHALIEPKTISSGGNSTPPQPSYVVFARAMHLNPGDRRTLRMPQLRNIKGLYHKWLKYITYWNLSTFGS